MEAVQEFLRETTEPKRLSKRMRRETGDASELTRMLIFGVIPYFKRLAFGADVSAAALDQALRAFELRARFLAAENPAQWHEATVPTLLGSAELRDIRSYAGDIVQGLMNRSLMSASLRQSQRTAIHFYFDIPALLGSHFVRHPFASLAEMLLKWSIPRYRAVDRRELYKPLDWQGVPRDAPTAVIIAGAVDRLGNAHAGISWNEISILFKLLSGWQLSPPSAAKAILREQIGTAICGQLVRVAGKLTSGSDFSHSLLAVAVSVLDFCRPCSPMAARRTFWETVSRRVAVGNSPFPDITGLSAVDFLRNDEISWSAGFNESISVRERRLTSELLLREFIGAKVEWSMNAGHLVPRFPSDPVDDTVAFGRALGLAIVNGVDLQSLRLNRAVAEFLHPRFRVTASDLAVVESQIGPATIVDVLGIFSGLDDILGRGGFEVVTDEEWLSLFGHSL